MNQAQVRKIFQQGHELLREEMRELARNKVCYLEIEHAWPPLREKQVNRALKDLDRGLKDQRIDADQQLTITSQAFFYNREGEWYRVIEVKPQ